MTSAERYEPMSMSSAGSSRGVPRLSVSAREMSFRASVSTVKWTGESKYTVDGLASKLMARATTLNLGTRSDEGALLIDIGSYLATLVTNYLHTGKFKRSV